ncbi:MAG TPA: hypothetical protein VKA36_07490 [Solirubrobacterales bacterium]|nr:hypothetical protein [Solirubrobacterales bacterium]
MASKASKRRRKKRRAKDQAPSGAPAETGEDSTAGAVAAGEASGAPERSPARKAAPARRRRRGAIDDEAPPAPWGSFPLIEITVLVGIVMLVIGLVFVEGDRGVILIGTGLVLASIGGLEVSIREHLAGYRSHTLILAGVPTAVALGVLFKFATDMAPGLRVAIGAAVFALAAYGLTRLFRRRSGGYSYRFSGLRRR